MRPPVRRGAGRGSAGEDTRSRIIEAARELLVAEGFRGFTVEKVADRAGVSRMTVYYQFASKQDLLEAVLDDFGARGRIDRLPQAFAMKDAEAALAAFISIFCGFWASNRPALRRLRSWAALERGAEEAGHERDEWRRRGVQTIVRRLREQLGTPPEHEEAEVVDLLHTLTSFESYDSLARGGRTPEEVARLMNLVARAILGLRGEPTGA
ncbi:MAG TPA: TetR/AcrR family transcriptional regulator [Longimicrobiales bacterium]|nr:TetR/AcrR family transcriptional regulator [Longimicrobiales bacterium]